MANPPPIIRSSKAFSVEIPEGSNSAKSRRSDIVASDDLEIHRKSSQFHEAGADSLKSPDFHTNDAADSRSVSVASTDHEDNLHHEAQADADKDRYAGEDSHKLSENLQGIDQSQTSDNVISVADREQNAANRQAVDEDAYRDRQAHGDSGQALQDRFAAETHSPLKDRALSVEAQGLRSNLQGIAQDALRDNQQSIDNEALHNNQQALADEGLHNNQQSIDNEALHNNQQALADEGLHNNQQSIDNEALHGRKDTQEKTHVQDHVVALPDTHQVLKSGPSPLTAHAHPGQRPSVAVHAQTPLHPEADPQHAAMSKAEKAKRMEEFHGRVEAIRKSVSGINHLLDDLQDKP